MINNSEMRKVAGFKKNVKSVFKDNEPEAPNERSNDNTNNSFEQIDNVSLNDSQTILSEEKQNTNNNSNKKNNVNYISGANQGYYKSNNYNNDSVSSNNNISNNSINNNFRKLKHKTIETVVENVGEENCSYNQVSAGRDGGDNDPIVTFIFYKEENIEGYIEENKSYDYINNIYNDKGDSMNEASKHNQDKSLSLNLNNFESNNADRYNNNDNDNDNIIINKDGNFNINEMIDNISQSEIFSNIQIKQEKSLLKSNNNLEKKANRNNKENKNLEEMNSNNQNANTDKNDNRQTVKYEVLFSEIVQACPIIQFSADTSKVWDLFYFWQYFIFVLKFSIGVFYQSE